MIYAINYYGKSNFVITKLKGSINSTTGKLQCKEKGETGVELAKFAI